MKLAIVIPGFQSDEQDWCIPVFTNLAHRLALSTEVHVFALRYPGRRHRYAVGRVQVHATGGGAMAGRRWWGLSLLRLWRQALADIHAEHARSPFAAIIGIWATESGWLAARAARSLGVPSLVHLAGGELVWLPSIRYGNMGPGLAALLVRATLNTASCLTVPSLPVKRALLQHWPANGTRVEDWAPGVDTGRFAPVRNQYQYTATDGRPFTFVTAGSLIPVKCHEWLLDALALLRRIAPEHRVRLVVAGAGPRRAVLHAKASRLGLEGYVEFTGELPHHELPGLFAGADCFILGSRYEAQCMAALEAMACELPWVAPVVGAIADVAATDRPSAPTGIPVPGRTPYAMAQAMLQMLTLLPDTRKQWGRAARQRVVTGYQLDTQTRRLLDIIARLSG
jgi:glycosyltransferase involved in cell wall biosynthesis